MNQISIHGHVCEISAIPGGSAQRHEALIEVKDGESAPVVYPVVLSVDPRRGETPPAVGSGLWVVGEVASKKNLGTNNYDDIVRAFAWSTAPLAGQPNAARVGGQVYAEPEMRFTSSGKALLSLTLKAMTSMGRFQLVQATYFEPNNPSEERPSVERLAETLKAGQFVLAYGRPRYQVYTSQTRGTMRKMGVLASSLTVVPEIGAAAQSGY